MLYAYCIMYILKMRRQECLLPFSQYEALLLVDSWMEDFSYKSSPVRVRYYRISYNIRDKKGIWKSLFILAWSYYFLVGREKIANSKGCWDWDVVRFLFTKRLLQRSSILEHEHGYLKVWPKWSSNDKFYFSLIWGENAELYHVETEGGVGSLCQFVIYTLLFRPDVIQWWNTSGAGRKYLSFYGSELCAPSVKVGELYICII